MSTGIGIHIGDIEVTPVHDGLALLPPTALYRRPQQLPGRGDQDEDWLPHRQLLTRDGRLEMPVGSYLVRTADRVAIIDTGFGPNPPSPCEGGHLLRSLAAEGLSPSDVTDVVFTHLHADHIGWTSVDGVATFPNAVHRCDQADWDHFVTRDGHEDIRALLAPVAPQVETWDTDSTLLPGLDARRAPGHTPGSTILVVSSGTDRAMLLGDVVHCPAELVDDEWQGLADIDPVQARRTRQSLVQELDEAEVLVGAAHFPGLRFGRVLLGRGTRSWHFAGQPTTPGS